MPPTPEKLLTPEEEELQRKQASLAELEAQLADRELELASLLADLVHFEKCYLQTVGRRYAMLDDLKAKIAEARAKQNPDKQDAHDNARQARSQAQESARAVGDENLGSASPDDAASPSKPGVDGAIVMTYGFKVAGYNAIIERSLRGSECRLIGGDGTQLQRDEILTHRGSRHQSALSYISAVPYSFAFAISQDGGISAFHNPGNGCVVCGTGMRALD